MFNIFCVSVGVEKKTITVEPSAWRDLLVDSNSSLFIFVLSFLLFPVIITQFMNM